MENKQVVGFAVCGRLARRSLVVSPSLLAVGLAVMERASARFGRGSQYGHLMGVSPFETLVSGVVADWGVLVTCTVVA